MNETAPRPLQAQDLKIRERKRFVSPMPKLKDDADAIPTSLTIVAGCAAVVSLTFSILIYLKH